jgi:dTDP-4-amino-4,6-dideoxygalactose transaminase
MPNLNAALLLSQLESFDSILKSKRLLAEEYNSFFKANNFAKYISEPQNAQSNYWLNSLMFGNISLRDKFLQQTNQAGIMTRPVWTLMSQLPMYDKEYCVDLTNAKYLAQTVVNIPSSARL